MPSKKGIWLKIPFLFWKTLYVKIFSKYSLWESKSMIRNDTLWRQQSPLFDMNGGIMWWKWTKFLKGKNALRLLLGFCKV